MNVCHPGNHLPGHRGDQWWFYIWLVASKRATAITSGTFLERLRAFMMCLERQHCKRLLKCGDKEPNISLWVSVTVCVILVSFTPFFHQEITYDLRANSVSLIFLTSHFRLVMWRFSQDFHRLLLGRKTANENFFRPKTKLIPSQHKQPHLDSSMIPGCRALIAQTPITWRHHPFWLVWKLFVTQS